MQNSIPAHRAVACSTAAAAVAAKSSFSGMDAAASARRKVLRREHAPSHVGPLSMSDRITVSTFAWCGVGVGFLSFGWGLWMIGGLVMLQGRVHITSILTSS